VVKQFRALNATRAARMSPLVYRAHRNGDDLRTIMHKEIEMFTSYHETKAL